MVCESMDYVITLYNDKKKRKSGWIWFLVVYNLFYFLCLHFLFVIMFFHKNAGILFCFQGA